MCYTVINVNEVYLVSFCLSFLHVTQQATACNNRNGLAMFSALAGVAGTDDSCHGLQRLYRSVERGLLAMRLVARIHSRHTVHTRELRLLKDKLWDQGSFHEWCYSMEGSLHTQHVKCALHPELGVALWSTCQNWHLGIFCKCSGIMLPTEQPHSI